MEEIRNKFQFVSLFISLYLNVSFRILTYVSITFRFSTYFNVSFHIFPFLNVSPVTYRVLTYISVFLLKFQFSLPKMIIFISKSHLKPSSSFFFTLQNLINYFISKKFIIKPNHFSTSIPEIPKKFQFLVITKKSYFQFQMLKRCL